MNKELILQYLQDNNLKELHEELCKINPVDIAELLSELDNKNTVIVFRLLDKELAADIFSYMDNEQRHELIESFTQSEIIGLINSMYADDAVDFLADIPANVVTYILDNADREVRQDINKLLQYSDDSVGSIMTVEFVELNKNMDVKQAL